MTEQYLEQFVTLANGTKLSILVSMIVANLILGLAVSIYSKTFRLGAVADFMMTRVLPYILAYFAVVILAMVVPEWKTAVPVVWGIIVLALTSKILAKLKEMGIKIPEILAGRKPPGG